MGLPFCIKTPPIPIPLASHSILKDLLKSGKASNGDEVKQFFTLEKISLMTYPTKFNTFLCKLIQRGCNGAQSLIASTIDSSTSTLYPESPTAS